MTIEVALLISMLSVSGALIFGFKNMNRNERKDNAEEITQMTTMVVKLENIATGISEIKTDMRSVKSEMNDMRERLTIVEQATKSAHRRLDEMTHEV